MRRWVVINKKTGRVYSDTAGSGGPHDEGTAGHEAGEIKKVLRLSSKEEAHESLFVVADYVDKSYHTTTPNWVVLDRLTKDIYIEFDIDGDPFTRTGSLLECKRIQEELISQGMDEQAHNCIAGKVTGTKSIIRAGAPLALGCSKGAQNNKSVKGSLFSRFISRFIRPDEVETVKQNVFHRYYEKLAHQKFESLYVIAIDEKDGKLLHDYRINGEEGSVPVDSDYYSHTYLTHWIKKYKPKRVVTIHNHPGTDKVLRFSNRDRSSSAYLKETLNEKGIDLFDEYVISRCSKEKIISGLYSV